MLIQVTTTTNAGSRFVRVQSRRGDMSVLMKPGEQPAATLRRTAAEHRAQAMRLLARAERCEAGADVLLTPAA